MWVQVQGTTVIKIVRVAPPNLPPEGAWLDHSAALHLEKCSISFAAVRMPQNCLDRPKVSLLCSVTLMEDVLSHRFVALTWPVASERVSSCFRKNPTIEVYFNINCYKRASFDTVQGKEKSKQFRVVLVIQSMVGPGMTAVILGQRMDPPTHTRKILIGR